MTAPAPAHAERVRLLQKAPLYAGLDSAVLEGLARASALERLDEGEYLFVQGDPSERLYVVCQGAIAIVLSSADGRELVINEMRPGDSVGELSVLTRRPRSASAVAQTESQLLAISGPAFWEALVAASELARRLLVLTAERLQDSSEREAVLAFMDAEARVARLLLYLDRLSERSGYITISQADLARWAGLTRQTVATILGRWRRRGWLVTGRGRIVLFDYAGLGQVGQQF
jgi:CRP/FNR family cyclic AMP-dependent transcriptional regulator